MLLKERLEDHFNRVKQTHKARAKKLGQSFDVEFIELWIAAQTFELKCPFCARSLVDLLDKGELNLLHWRNHMINQNEVVFGCRSCNHEMTHKCADDILCFLKRKNVDQETFFKKLAHAASESAEQMIEELIELDSMGDCIAKALRKMSIKLSYAAKKET